MQVAIKVQPSSDSYECCLLLEMTNAEALNLLRVLRLYAPYPGEDMAVVDKICHGIQAALGKPATCREPGERSE